MNSILLTKIHPASKKLDIAGKYIGSAVMLAFGIIALVRWNNSGLLFFLLLAFRDMLASFFFLIRRDAVAIAGWKESLVAYVSAVIPLMYSADFSNPLFFTPATALLISNVLSIAGFLLVALATIDLGDCLGVAPANRDRTVDYGVYKIIRHPMYSGYLVAESGLGISVENLLLFIISFFLYRYRGLRETSLLHKRPFSLPNQFSTR